jgi:hypothetical protein
MSGLQINCKACGKRVPAEDVNLEVVLAKCRDCHAVFDFSDQVERPATPAKQRRDRGEVPMPAAFTARDPPVGPRDRLVLHDLRRNLERGDPGPAGRRARRRDEGFEDRAAGRELHLPPVRHGPMPWPGARRLETSDIDQLFCVEYVAYQQNKQNVYKIALHALTKSGDRVKLVTGMDTAEQGVFLEQLLEKHLRIEDRPVSGEHRS